ncbi:MAG: CHASE domain-containing protein, partial [Candidatus Levybacteria bacterium]|nr:CHASE domain-containing protein [Candidatus Levybacteria bacterium]
AEERDRLRFENAVQQTRNTIHSRLETYIGLLRGGSALYAARPKVTQDEFRLYIERLRLAERYPGIQGIGFTPRISQNEKDSFILNVQANGYDNFAITPEGNRSEYFPIYFIEPLDRRNRAAIGFDMFSDPARRDAMERARDTGTRAASGKVTLVQEIDGVKQAGFLIYVPIYQGSAVPATIIERREQLQGFVYSPFRADDLLSGISGENIQQRISFKVYDGETASEAMLLHDSKTVSNKDPSYNSRFKTTRQIDVAGEPWTLTFTNDPLFESESQSNFAPYILIGGLIISGLLFFISRSQFVARKNAERAAAELFVSQKELQKAIGMRDNFISIASHELKTPITSLKIYTEVMQRKFQKTGQNDALKNMTKMNTQIEKLSNLISDLLDVTRIQSGKLAFHEEVFDMSLHVKEIVESTQPITEKHQLTFKGSANTLVLGDKDRIGQVISNFLTNAIKYSPDANKVTISVIKKENKAIVNVRDYGIGIDNIHLKKVFNRFYRVAESNEKTFPGLGIGLYICFEIIKRHNGQIDVQSVKGKGSTFTFSLPLVTKAITPRK